jgi:release factor glutamine methyltransferase
VHEQLVAARRIFVRAGIDTDEAEIDAEVLARSVLGWDRAALIARWREPPPPSFDTRFQSLVARRASREPVAFITGHREFWGLDFEVTPAVLIPRPETELIVEEALRHAREEHAPETIIDIGTGSGCIAIALAAEFPSARVTATDSSASALAIAQRNAERLGVADRVRFVQADLLDDDVGQSDLIVSNPPYVPDGDAATLQTEVIDYEPRTALFGGTDGHDVIRRLLASAGDHLRSDGRVILEFGFGQDQALRDAALTAGWQVTRVSNDLQGIPRVAVLRR